MLSYYYYLTHNHMNNIINPFIDNVSELKKNLPLRLSTIEKRDLLRFKTHKLRRMCKSGEIDAVESNKSMHNKGRMWKITPQAILKYHNPGLNIESYINTL